MDQLRPLQQYLPDGFRYAGVIAFSGAIFSRRGLNYRYDTPAPTFFLHGTADRLVPYRQIKLLNIGFYGSDRVAGGSLQERTLYPQDPPFHRRRPYRGRPLLHQL